METLKYGTVEATRKNKVFLFKEGMVNVSNTGEI